MTNQKKDFHWFLDHYADLYKKYGHTFLAIKDGAVIGTYQSYAQGVRETAKTEPIGTFIVQECGPDENAYTVHITAARFAI